jgi:hypothetical protein
MKRSLRIISTLVFLLLFAFIPGDIDGEYKIPIFARQITACDLNLDGDIDIIVAHSYSFETFWSGVSIEKNINKGLFTYQDSIYVYGNQEWIFATKINNDPYPDIIVKSDISGNTTYAAILFYNNGTYLQNNVMLGDQVSKLDTGDINGDGFTDFVFVSNINKYWGVTYNDGNGNFSTSVQYPLSFYPGDLTTGDLNGDGKVDLVISGQTPVIEFSGTNGFINQTLSGFFDQVNIADINNTTIKDIVGVVSITPFTPTIYIYKGSTNFTTFIQLSLPFRARQFVISDINNDSLPDLIFLPTTDDGLYIIYNQGNYSFANPEFIPIVNNGEDYRKICCADFDGNGFNDFALIREGGPNGNTFNNLILLYNDGQGHFLPDPITLSPERFYPQLGSIRNYPNPFKDQTNFELELKAFSKVYLSVYNSKGGFIKCLMDKKWGVGRSYLSWNGKDQNEIPCKPGVYLVCLKINGKIQQSIKIILY